MAKLSLGWMRGGLALCLGVLLFGGSLNVAFAATVQELLSAGQVAFQKGDYPNAIRVLKYTTTQRLNYDQSFNTYYYLGLSQAKSGQFAQAKDAFAMAAQYVPPNSPNQQKLLRLINALGQQSVQGGGTPTASVSNQQVVQQANSQSQGNYISFALHEGQVLHWDKTKLPIKVYIKNGNGIANWTLATNQAIRTAWGIWQSNTNGLLQFQEVSSEAAADIMVSWDAKMDSEHLGETPIQWTETQITRADIILSTHNPISGKPLSVKAITSTAVHELGHALGIQGHSPNPNDIMYWSSNEATAERMALTGRDITTMKLLYNMEANISNRSKSSVKQVAAAYNLAKTAQNYADAQNYQAAYATIKQALAKAPDAVPVLALGGSIAVSVKNNAQAELWLKEAVRLDPKHTGSRYNLAITQLNTAYARLRQNLGDATTVGYLQNCIALVDGTQPNESVSSSDLQRLRGEASSTLGKLKAMMAAH